MLFDDNYNKLIELLGKYDEDFLIEHQKFIARFPSKLIEKACKGQEFDKKTLNSRSTYITNSRITKHAHNLSLLDKKDAFSSLNVYPCEINDMNLGAVNSVLSLSIGHIISRNKTYSFLIFKEGNKKFLQSTLDNDMPSNPNNFRRTLYELTDEEFEFITDTISQPFEKDYNKDI